MSDNILTQPVGTFLTAVIIVFAACLVVGTLELIGCLRRAKASKLVQKADGTFGVDQLRAARIAELAKTQDARPRLHAVKGKAS